MKGTKVLKAFTELFWLFLAALPLIAYLIYSSNDTIASGELLTFGTYVEEKLGFFVPWSNVITETVAGIFGQNGVMPILTDNVIAFVTYFCVIELVRIVVDVLLWIPRLFKGFVQKFGGEMQ